jgi:hypothetical protein
VAAAAALAALVALGQGSRGDLLGLVTLGPVGRRLLLGRLCGLELGYVKGGVRVVGVEPDGMIVPTSRWPTLEVSSPFDQNVTSVPSSNFHVTPDADVEAHDSSEPFAPRPAAR